MSEQIIEDNTTIRASLLKYLDANRLDRLSFEEKQALLQSLCELIQLPNGGFVCATNEAGDIIAPPRLAPDAPAMNIGISFITDLRETLRTEYAGISANEVTTGIYYKGPETHLIAFLPIANTGIKLFVHQDMDIVEANVDATVRPLYGVGHALSMAVGLFTILISNRLINRYEHKLELVNAGLSEALSEREVFYQAFHHSRHSVFVADEQQHIAYANPAIMDMYQMDQLQVDRLNTNALIPSTTECADLGIGDNEREMMALQFGCSKHSELQDAVSHKRANGSIVWVEQAITPLFDEKGNIAHRIGIALDVSERRAHELEIRYEFYRALAELAETRDNETGAHLIRVSQYARWLAEEMGMPKKFCEDIERFTPLHDIGKVGIPDSILLAPRRLTDHEFEIMRTHCELGHSILEGRETLEMAADICASHHEKYDGTGYPRRLSGEAIPMAARIVAVADVYDALRSDRPYKDGWTHERTVDVLKQDSGTHFDPIVIDAFDTIHARFEEFADAHADHHPSLNEIP